jgi:hypothetical protein
MGNSQAHPVNQVGRSGYSEPHFEFGANLSPGDRFCVPVRCQRCEMLLLVNEVRLRECWENDDPIPKCLQEKIVIRLFPIVGRRSVQSIAKNVRQKFPTRQTLQVFYNSKIVWAGIPVGG